MNILSQELIILFELYTLENDETYHRIGVILDNSFNDIYFCGSKLFTGI